MNVAVVISINFKKLQINLKKKLETPAGFKPMASALARQRSTN